MKPPAALAQDLSTIRIAGPARCRERQTWATTLARRYGAGVIEIQAHDLVHLALKVSRFFNA
jgi:hypothetical protein